MSASENGTALSNGASAPRLQNWVDGALRASSTAVYIPVTTPYTGEVIAHVPLSTKADVDIAVASAKAAYEKWSSRTVKDRVQILLKYHYLIAHRYSKELAEIITKEHGKCSLEALQEVAKANETVEYACALPEVMQGKTFEVSRGVVARDEKRPVGVVLGIVPFNFPTMVPHWTIPIALACGNTYILKSSEKVPLTALKIAEILKEAGLPDGVFSVVNGASDTVNALIDHPDVQCVTFVGTTKIAEMVAHRARLLNKRVLALGGAKNHLIAHPDANLEMTADDVMRSAFGSTGQRCMAASVLLTLGEQPKLIEKIIEKSSALKGGSNPGEIGPVIDKASQDRIVKYIDNAENNGVKILLDGRKWAKERSEGFWLGPTILLHPDLKDPAITEEIFGPVLSVYVCSSADEAIRIENSNPYGNAACIYTSSGGVAE
ncbi:hypothetical protein HDU93_007805 [Gonapodya sp. JEL0774]|nr:hypothetical protein HDU93_007805 [Gonapodya sp. JEL0774]